MIIDSKRNLSLRLLGRVVFFEHQVLQYFYWICDFIGFMSFFVAVSLRFLCDFDFYASVLNCSIIR